MGERLVVGRRGVKIIHFKLLPVNFDDIALAVTGLGLLMKHFNRSFDNLILLLLIGVHQFVDVTEHIGKKMHVEPDQTPKQNEDWPNVVSPAFFASPVTSQNTQTSEKSRDSDQQTEDFIAKNAVTISGDFKNGGEF